MTTLIKILDYLLVSRRWKDAEWLLSYASDAGILSTDDAGRLFETRDAAAQLVREGKA